MVDGQPNRRWIRCGLGALVVVAPLVAPVEATSIAPAAAGGVTCPATPQSAPASASTGRARACESRVSVRPVPPQLPAVIEVNCASDCEVRAAAEVASAVARAVGIAASAAAARSERAEELYRLQLATREQHAQWLRWLALVLGLGALAAGVLAGLQAGRDEGVRFHRHWGGFGGADGGWRMSSALANLVICAVLGGAAVLVMLQAAPETSGPPAPAGEPAAKK